MEQTAGVERVGLLFTTVTDDVVLDWTNAIDCEIPDSAEHQRDGRLKVRC